MSNATAIAEIDAAIARLQHAKDELLSEEVSSPWCTVADYAAHARVHVDTVRKWVVDGMPASDVKRTLGGTITGTKRTTRIDRIKADAWRASR